MTLPVSTSRFPYYRWETVCMYLKKRVEMAKRYLSLFQIIVNKIDIRLSIGVL